jgi:hypothetical protein
MLILDGDFHKRRVVRVLVPLREVKRVDLVPRWLLPAREN